MTEAASTFTVRMRRYKDCRNTIHFRAVNRALVDSIYIDKFAFDAEVPAEITITVNIEPTS